MVGGFMVDRRTQLLLTDSDTPLLSDLLQWKTAADDQLYRVACPP